MPTGIISSGFTEELEEERSLRKRADKEEDKEEDKEVKNKKNR